MATTFLQAYPWLALLLNLWLATFAGCVIYLLLAPVMKPQVVTVAVRPVIYKFLAVQVGSLLITYGKRGV